MALPQYNEETILVEAGKLAPAEAIEFFRKKGFKITWSWRETLKQADQQAFTVAKSMHMDILQEIRKATDKAIADGLSFEQFRDSIEPFLRRRGWWGMKTVNGQRVQLGSVHRLKTIYSTNTQSAYNAGRWDVQQRAKRVLPFLRLNEVLDAKTRSSHANVSGTIAPIDDPFWDRWYPPNGFNCRGRAQSLTEAQAKGSPIEAQKIPKIKPDKGFDHNNGKVFDLPKKDIDSDLKKAGENLKKLGR